MRRTSLWADRRGQFGTQQLMLTAFVAVAGVTAVGALGVGASESFVGEAGELDDSAVAGLDYGLEGGFGNPNFDLDGTPPPISGGDDCGRSRGRGRGRGVRGGCDDRGGPDRDRGGPDRDRVGGARDRDRDRDGPDRDRGIGDRPDRDRPDRDQPDRDRGIGGRPDRDRPDRDQPDRDSPTRDRGGIGDSPTRDRPDRAPPSRDRGLGGGTPTPRDRGGGDRRGFAEVRDRLVDDYVRRHDKQPPDHYSLDTTDPERRHPSTWTGTPTVRPDGRPGPVVWGSNTYTYNGDTSSLLKQLNRPLARDTTLVSGTHGSPFFGTGPGSRMTREERFYRDDANLYDANTGGRYSVGEGRVIDAGGRGSRWYRPSREPRYDERDAERDIVDAINRNDRNDEHVVFAYCYSNQTKCFRRAVDDGRIITESHTARDKRIRERRQQAQQEEQRFRLARDAKRDEVDRLNRESADQAADIARRERDIERRERADDTLRERDTELETARSTRETRERELADAERELREAQTSGDDARIREARQRRDARHEDHETAQRAEQEATTRREEAQREQREASTAVPDRDQANRELQAARDRKDETDRLAGEADAEHQRLTREHADAQRALDQAEEDHRRQQELLQQVTVTP